MADIAATLKNEGSRMTKARTALARIFSKTEAPLSVQELRQALLKSRVRSNKTTVYRELSSLVEKGLVREVQIPGEQQKRFESAVSKHHHHITCTRCGEIVDVELPTDVDLFSRTIEKKTGFRITGHVLEFSGLCKQCA